MVTLSANHRVAASLRKGSARLRSMTSAPRLGQSMSSIEASGARTRKRSRCPSGLMKDWIVTSLGISCAAGRDGSPTNSARTSAAANQVNRDTDKSILTPSHCVVQETEAKENEGNEQEKLV